MLTVSQNDQVSQQPACIDCWRKAQSGGIQIVKAEVIAADETEKKQE